MELFEHNQKTLNELNSYTDRKKNCCVVNPCGSGKTSVMAEFIRQHSGARFVVFTKQINAKQYYIDKDPVFAQDNVYVVTYSKMYKDYREHRITKYKADYYILDEAHYIGADNWSTAFEFFYEKYKPLLIGFTATPQRFFDQGTENTIVTSYFQGNSAGNYTARDLQKRGVFVEPEYVLSLYDLASEIEDKVTKIEDSDMEEGKKIYYISKLNKVKKEWEKASNPDIILNRHIPKFLYKEDNNRILVYVSNMADINEKEAEINHILQDIAGDKKLRSYRYTYRDTESQLKSFLEDDDSYIKVLYSIDKIMETIHIDDLNIIIMLRPSISNRIITQQFGRVNNVNNRKKSLIIDMVDNLGNLNSIKFLGGGEGKNTEKKNMYIEIPSLQAYKNIFNEIDAAMKLYPVYTYKGFYGSLSQFAKVFHKDYAELRRLVVDCAMSIEEALETARTLRFTRTEKIFNSEYEYPEFTLTDKQKEIVAKCIPHAEKVFKTRNIKDDDIKQNLYMEMMYRISLMPEDYSGSLTTYIRNILVNKYVLLYRDKLFRDGLYTPINNGYAAETNIAEKVAYDETKWIIREVLDTLTDREKNVLLLRFGFETGNAMNLEDVGKRWSVTRERVRQIEAKAIRKLRHPSRVKRFRCLFDFCN